jgi:MFS family permease
MPPQLPNPWRHKDFLKLWSARTTSIFGSELASLAYPLTAILILQATTFQMGMLQAVRSASATIVGIFAGVIVDRIVRRPLLITRILGGQYLS